MSALAGTACYACAHLNLLMHHPILSTNRYVAIYKKKTTEIYTDNKYAIDGCATFFRRDRCGWRRPGRGAWHRGSSAGTCTREKPGKPCATWSAILTLITHGLCACLPGRVYRFSLVKKYEVEFNKAALSLAEGMTNPQQKKAALNRLLKVGRV
jgi:CCR4-NOT transcription complex subunit 6